MRPRVADEEGYLAPYTYTGASVCSHTHTHTNLGDSEAKGSGLGVGLAGINHHKALVFGESKVPSCCHVPDSKWLAPAEVASTPAVEGDSGENQGTPP